MLEPPTETKKLARQRLKVPARMGLAVASMAAYVMFFHAVYPVAGPATGAFFFSVVATWGWLFGVRGGLLGAAGALPISLLTYGAVEVAGPDVGFAGHAAATIANLILGYVTGRWSDTSLQNHRQRQHLEAQERRHRMTLAASRDVIWELDFRTGVVSLSDEVCGLLALPAEAKPKTLTGWLAHVHPDDRARVSEEWGHASTAKDAGSIAYRLVRADGSIVHAVDRFLIERDATGGPLRSIGAIADVSEQIRAAEQAQDLREAAARERQLQQMNEFKSQLLNMASHELNTPLSALRIQLFLLKKQVGESAPADMMKCIDILDRNTSRLARLIADTLDVARIQNGRLSLRPEPHQFSKVLEETLAAYQPVAQERGVALDANLESDPTVDADPARLTQVMFNLVSNAIKFAKSRIQVAVRREGEDLLVVVDDDGLGVPTHLQGRLFLPFSQLHESSTAANKGNGLGLYISRNLVELHGGRMWCQSEGPGRGSQFGFRVPLAQSARRPVALTPDAPSQAPLLEAAAVDPIPAAEIKMVAYSNLAYPVVGGNHRA